MPSDLPDARAKGRAEMLAALEGAPEDPRARLAWAQGASVVDLLDMAVRQAREAGLMWKEIAEALGEVESTVRVRYTQRGRWQRYKAKREGGD